MSLRRSHAPNRPLSRAHNGELRSLLFVILSLVSASFGHCEDPNRLETHPLMPGIRCPGLLDKDWPRPMHDKLATGFSPLTCGMKEAPTIWSRIKIPGQAAWLRVLSHAGQPDRLLVCDSKLRMFSATGEQLWTQPPADALVCNDHLTGTDREFLLLQSGRILDLRDAATGERVWSHTFEPEYVSLRVRVADILPEMPGMEAAVFLNHGEEGALVSFPPEGQPRIVWQKQVTKHGEFDERYDHVCQIELDLSDPQRPVIWNVRRYRCRGFDARTGDMLSSVEYDIGGEHRRNYGPAGIGRAKNGDALALVVAEDVQVHVHGIRLHRQGTNELAWQHYYGEVYHDAPGVALEHLSFFDADQDGATDVCYSVRDPAKDFRSFVRIRDGETGVVKYELADCWGAKVYPPEAPDGSALLLAYGAPHGAMPKRGQLDVYAIGKDLKPRKLQSFPNASVLSLADARSDGERNSAILRANRAADLGKNAPAASAQDAQRFVLREQADDGSTTIGEYSFDGDRLKQLWQASDSRIATQQLAAILRNDDQIVSYVVAASDGELLFLKPDDATRAKHLLDGASGVWLAAADLDRDGRAELIAAMSTGRLAVYHFEKDGRAARAAEYAYAVKGPKRGPVAYDFLGDGRLEMITLDSAPDGRLLVSAQPLNQPPIWQATLDVNAEDAQGCTVNAGQFLAGDHSAVAVSLTDAHLVHEGTYLLDGHNGRLVWSKNHYQNFGAIMPFRAEGIPTAFDFDRDGAEELGMDLLSFMAYVRGGDGEFAFIQPTHNVSMDQAVANGHLYNTYCPIYASPMDARPHWMVTGGFGPFGMMGVDPHEKLWGVDLQYDGPPNVGMIDVDGDGVLETGYCAANSKKFVCRNIWNGKVKWELELPYAPNSPTITADVDGDGRGEFLTGPFCIGAAKDDRGELRWQSPAAIGWAVIADFDGDGRGEIACQQGNEVVVLKGK